MDSPSADALPPPPPPGRLVVATWMLLGAAFCVLVAAILLRQGLTFSASAAPWLEALGRTGNLTDDGVVGVLLRKAVAATGQDPASILKWLQFAVTTSLLGLVGGVAWQVHGPVAGASALALLLAWPAGRDAVAHVSVESLLALGTLVVAATAQRLAEAPRLAALGLALALTLAFTAHPLGLAAAPGLALAALLFPTRAGPNTDDGGLMPGHGLSSPAVWLPWLAALLTVFALLVTLLPSGSIKTLWLQMLATMRAPTPGLQLGWLASKPVLGPLAAIAGQVPVLLLVAVLAAGKGAVRRPGDPAALPAILLGFWLLVLAAVGLPMPGHLDGLALVAPLLTLLAGCTVVELGMDLWRKRERVGLAAVAVAAIGALATDLWLARNDRRTGLGQLPGWLAVTEPLRPATLGPGDLALLQQHPLPTAILPARPGGNRLAHAIKVLHPALAQVGYAPPYAAHLVLLPARPSHPVDRAFEAAGERLSCSRHTCLHRLRGRTSLTR